MQRYGKIRTWRKSCYRLDLQLSCNLLANYFSCLIPLSYTIVLVRYFKMTPGNLLSNKFIPSSYFTRIFSYLLILCKTCQMCCQKFLSAIVLYINNLSMSVRFLTVTSDNISRILAKSYQYIGTEFAPNLHFSCTSPLAILYALDDFRSE